MNRPPECIACLVSNRIGDLREAGAGEEAYSLFLQILPKVIKKKRTEAFSDSFKVISDIMGKKDLYYEKKKALNSLALELLKNFDGKELSEEELLRVGAAANIFDTSVLGYTFKLESLSLQALLEEPAIDEIDRINWESINSIVYVTDNSGEAVIDSFIMRKLSKLGYSIVAVAREDPYEIDATAPELEELLGGEVKVVRSKGNTSPLYMNKNNKETKALLQKGDLVIAKGIANLEGYIDSRRKLKGKTMFLLRAKCPLIARTFNVKKGTPLAVVEETAWKVLRKINQKEKSRKAKVAISNQ